MMDKKIKLLYFSPTGTTKKIVKTIGSVLERNISVRESLQEIDFTLAESRKNIPEFVDRDIVIVGVPVYAGRVPNILLDYLESIRGDGAIAIPLVLYGNRNYDNALIELRDILQKKGFRIIAAAAFIGEHSFSRTLAKDRPDSQDLKKAREFAEAILLKLEGTFDPSSLFIKGDKDYNSYYVPLGKDGKKKDIRKVIPKTSNNCINCKLCAKVCPMGSIDIDNVSRITGICVKCGACIKRCPVEAKYFDDPDYLFHKNDLEETFQERKDPEIFI